MPRFEESQNGKKFRDGRRGEGKCGRMEKGRSVMEEVRTKESEPNCHHLMMMRRCVSVQDKAEM